MKTKINLIKRAYRISFRKSFILKTLGATQKNSESFPLSKSKVKTKLLDHSGFFWANAIQN